VAEFFNEIRHQRSLLNGEDFAAVKAIQKPKLVPPKAARLQSLNASRQCATGERLFASPSRPRFAARSACSLGVSGLPEVCAA